MLYAVYRIKRNTDFSKMGSTMNKILETNESFSTILKLMETINQSTNDYLFVWDINSDKRWFFGGIDKHYAIRKNGSDTNSTMEMMKIIYQADRATVLESLTQVAKGKKNVHNMDYRWVNRDGQRVWISCQGTVIRDAQNNPHIMIGRVSEEKLRHLYNPLTSLWNKNKLNQDLKKHLEDSNGFLMCLDIDGFSAINLSYGRQYGDGLLKEIAKTCEDLEVVTMAYHIEHNDFALILNVNTQEEVRKVFDLIREAMNEKCTFTASVVPIDKSLFFNEIQLLESMNITLKKAKEHSGDRIEFFSLEELTKRIASLALLEELKKSVENNCSGFEVYYQPQIHTGSYNLYGVEALLRYNSKTRGRVFPDQFIPLLEQSGLIKDVGMWVLHQALVQCKEWRKILPNLRVSVNFSAIQFEDPDLAKKVVEKINEVGLNGEELTIEITESMELHNSEQSKDIIKELKSYNIKIALDDFGTGYSNLGYLKELHIDEIKIDRAFVAGIEKNAYNHRLVSNVIEFAKGNSIKTCCEGVESARELLIIEKMLPDAIQGYFFDKPNTAEIIEKTYIHPTTKEFIQRSKFIHKIYELKEKIGVIHFDPKDILYENGVGLWVMRINPEEERYELHVDEVMEQVMAIDMKHTPRTCYNFLISNIQSQYKAYVMESMEKMITLNRAVQIEFAWVHPKMGEVMLRFSGKRVNDADGMIKLEGYCRIITDVIGA